MGILSGPGAFAGAIALAAIALVLAPLGSTSPTVQAVDLVVAGIAGAVAATCLGIAAGARHRRRRVR